jgi:hypothetical protein
MAKGRKKAAPAPSLPLAPAPATTTAAQAPAAPVVPTLGRCAQGDVVKVLSDGHVGYMAFTIGVHTFVGKARQTQQGRWERPGGDLRRYPLDEPVEVLEPMTGTVGAMHRNDAVVDPVSGGVGDGGLL